jgi:hypothetical protein
VGHYDSHTYIVYHEVFYAQYNEKLLIDPKNTVTKYYIIQIFNHITYNRLLHLLLIKASCNQTAEC